MLKFKHRPVLSLSSAGRWVNCPASIAHNEYKDKSSAAADRGTAIHQVLEGGITEDSEIATLAEDCKFHLSELLKELGIDEACVEHEVRQVLFDTDGAGKSCIIDIKAISGDTLLIADYKTGMYRVSPTTLQLLLPALKISAQHTDVKNIVTAIIQPTVYNGAATARFTRESLRDKVQGIYEDSNDIREMALKGVVPNKYVPGNEQCRYCTALPCQALRSSMNNAVVDIESNRTIHNLSNDDIEIMHDQADAWSRAAKAVKGEVYRRLAEGVDMPGHKLVRGRAGHRKYTDDTLVLAILRGKGYAMDDIVDRSLKSPSALEKQFTKTRIQNDVGEFIVTPPGAVRVAAKDDSRPAIHLVSEDMVNEVFN